MALPSQFLRRPLATGGGGAGGASAYGSRPMLPGSSALQGNVTNILNSAIPGFSGLTQSATGIIGNALSGQLSPETQNNIQDAAAAQAVSGGMPGSSRISGTLFGNKVLRDIGQTTQRQQQGGVKDLIGMLQGYSGTAALTPGQTQDQENAIAQYASAPDPAAAAKEQERLYNKYSNPAAGAIPGIGGEDVPWWAQGPNGGMAENKLNNWNRRTFGFGSAI